MWQFLFSTRKYEDDFNTVAVAVLKTLSTLELKMYYTVLSNPIIGLCVIFFSVQRGGGLRRYLSLVRQEFFK